MALLSLRVERVRCLGAVSIDVSPGINLFVGPNGSGKTSILESVHLLSTARSFREQRLREILQRGASELLVSGEVGEATLATGRDSEDGVPQRIRVGVQYTGNRTKLRFDGRDATSVAELAHALPLVVLSPDSQRLLTEGSAMRRRLFDWSLFHVEPTYQRLHGAYRRALQQRNAALKSHESTRTIAAWTEELSRHGEPLHAARESALPALVESLQAAVASLCRVSVDVRFLRGWSDDDTLPTALDRASPSDRARGFTTVGPHRADLEFTVHDRPARSVLSRGESKRFVIAAILGQAAHLRTTTGRQGIVLFDELATDLDEEARADVMAELRALGVQCWITSVSAELVAGTAGPGDKRFNVNAGACVEIEPVSST